MKKFLILILLFFLNGQLCQAANIDSLLVKKLLEEKAVLLNANKNTSEVDLKLYQAGVKPTAVVSQKKQGVYHLVSFNLFRDYTNSRTGNLEPRLKVLFPNLISLDMNLIDKTVVLKFSSLVSNEDIGKLIKAFSYNGFISKD